MRNDRSEFAAGTGVLILHGFGGDPGEVAALAGYLKDAGISISAPLLPGHGGDKRELSRVSRRDWIAAAAMGYTELAARCSKVYVVGFSMGGLLAVHFLAGDLWEKNEHKEALSGLVTVNTPVYYWNFRQIASNLLKAMGDKTQREQWRNRYLSCARGLPLRAMAEFQLLLSGSKGLYRQLCCPALILQLADDDTVRPASGDYILRRMRGSRKLLKLPQGGHQIFQSGQAGEACRAIGSFIGISQEARQISAEKTKRSASAAAPVSAAVEGCM